MQFFYIIIKYRQTVMGEDSRQIAMALTMAFDCMSAPILRLTGPSRARTMTDYPGLPAAVELLHSWETWRRVNSSTSLYTSLCDVMSLWRRLNCLIIMVSSHHGIYNRPTSSRGGTAGLKFWPVTRPDPEIFDPLTRPDPVSLIGVMFQTACT